MRRFRFERFKLYILMILVVTSFIQVGILWNYQNEGLPTNFLLRVLGNNEKEVVIDVGDYIKPYRIIATEGYDEAHFVVDESHNYYSTLWNEAKSYITSLLKDKNIIYKQSYSEEYWGEVVIKKGFVYEFKTVISTSLLASLLDVNEHSELEFEGIYKMAVLTMEEVNNNIGLYVYDGIKTYRFVLPFNTTGLNRKDYDYILTEFQEDDSYDRYGVTKELFRDKMGLYSIKPDVLISQGGGYKGFDDIIGDVPYEIRSLNTDEKADLEKIATSILGKDKDRFDGGIDINNAIVFRNLSSTYKLHRDGLMEYKYLHQYDKFDKGSEIEALKIVLQFISEKSELVQGAEIYLTGVKDNSYEEYYTFNFDYKVNQMPVSFVNYPVNTGNQNFVNNAITIKANKKRVLSCYWIFKEFSKGAKSLKISTYPYDLFDDVFKKYRSINYKNFSIKDISISYEMKLSILSEHLKPVWLIETIDEKYYVVEMKEKKGD